MSNLEVSSVTKKFGDFVAVNDVSFTAEEGEFVTLLGPSGCGKTTLLKCIGGFFESLETGTISMGETIINDIPPEKRDTVMCFQSYALFPHLRIYKNISFGLEQQKMDKSLIKDRVDEVSKQVNIVEQLNKLPNQLSGGQQQRVALARAMAVRTSVILFDEPLSNLDAKLREKVRFEIRKLQNEMKFTAIYVTHDQQEAMAISDKIIVMNEGKIQQIGSPRDIYNYPTNTFVADFIGRANILKAKIIERKNNQYKVETEIGELIIIDQKNLDLTGTHYYVGWRPENIILQNTNNSLLNLIKVKVEQLAFLGSNIHMFVKHKVKNSDAYHECYLEMPAYVDVSDQSEFSISIVPEKMFFLEEIDE